MAELTDEVLVSLRRILRATSLHSRKLRRAVGLSAPQLLVLHTVAAETRPTATQLAKAVSLSQATMTTIVAELEERGLLARERSTEDRRRVHISLTPAGRALLMEAPKPLQESFETSFAALPRWEQLQILAVLERVAQMMDAEDLDAAPLLSESPDIE